MNKKKVKSVDSRHYKKKGKLLLETVKQIWIANFGRKQWNELKNVLRVEEPKM